MEKIWVKLFEILQVCGKFRVNVSKYYSYYSHTRPLGKAHSSRQDLGDLEALGNTNKFSPALKTLLNPYSFTY